MYFTMVDHTENGVTYTRRVGAMTPSFEKAKTKAIQRHGYIVDESSRVVAQAMNPRLPKYVGLPTTSGSIINIGSGEDCYA